MVKHPIVWITSLPDDVALSCGGLAWEQSGQGDVQVWTIALERCSGPLPRLAAIHARWDGPNAPAERAEDLAATEMGAVPTISVCPTALPPYRQVTHLYA
jgi:hypothetical protein